MNALTLAEPQSPRQEASETVAGLVKWLNNITNRFTSPSADSDRAYIQFHEALEQALIGPDRESPLLPQLQENFENWMKNMSESDA